MISNSWLPVNSITLLLLPLVDRICDDRGILDVLCEFNFMNIKRNIWQICETVQQNVFVGRSWDWILEEKKIPRGNDEDKCFPNSQTWIFLFFTHSYNQYQSLHLRIYVEHQYRCDCLIWKLMNTDKCPCKLYDSELMHTWYLSIFLHGQKRTTFPPKCRSFPTYRQGTRAQLCVCVRLCVCICLCLWVGLLANNEI